MAQGIPFTAREDTDSTVASKKLYTDEGASLDFWSQASDEISKKEKGGRRAVVLHKVI